MKLVIACRGRNTAAILRDAGVLEGTTVVVCRPGDRLAEPGDVLVPVAAARMDHATDITVIANGGTTDQLVPIVVAATEARWAAVRVINVQPDEVTTLVSLMADR